MPNTQDSPEDRPKALSRGTPYRKNSRADSNADDYRRCPLPAVLSCFFWILARINHGIETANPGCQNDLRYLALMRKMNMGPPALKADQMGS